eukprot:m51a1_g11825 putative acetylserotonin o-methyltransferase-like (215) ;mRNA; r:419658-420515
MIIHLLPLFNSKRIVLASGSPRRQEALRNIGLKFEVVVSKFAEDLDKQSFASPAAYCLETASRKCAEVWARLREEQRSADIVISADTVVVLDGRVLEKPSSPADAERMLRELSGRDHDVYTGVCIRVRTPAGGSDEGTVRQFTERTTVTFAELSPEAVRAYVATGSPLDKAGGYGIQDGGGSSFIKGIVGDYWNVTGIPVHHLCAELAGLAPLL